MSTLADLPQTRLSWFARTESWLDERGKAAWIAAMVLGFIFFWPVGLALLAYMIWSKRMFSKSSCAMGRARSHTMPFRSSGNSAFDAYKADTLRRLEDEQTAFQEFLQRLRESKDKAEFDNFMNDRAGRNERRSDRNGDRDDDRHDADPIEV